MKTRSPEPPETPALPCGRIDLRGAAHLSPLQGSPYMPLCAPILCQDTVFNGYQTDYQLKNAFSPDSSILSLIFLRRQPIQRNNDAPQDYYFPGPYLWHCERRLSWTLQRQWKVPPRRGLRMLPRLGHGRPGRWRLFRPFLPLRAGLGRQS